MDIRHQKRRDTIQNLFSLSFNRDAIKLPHSADTTTLKIIQNRDEIDNLIKGAAQKFPLEKIAKIDLAILRLALYELIIEKENPPKVVINEAVKLAKEFGGEHSYAFVNGVLGHVMLKLKS